MPSPQPSGLYTLGLPGLNDSPGGHVIGVHGQRELRERAGTGRFVLSRPGCPAKQAGMVSVIHPTTPASPLPPAVAEAAPPLRARASARVRRTLATATARPDRPTTITCHSQVTSTAAARARSRATPAVTGPIRLSSPGSEYHPARVRHGTQSTARPARRGLPGGPLRSCVPTGSPEPDGHSPGRGHAVQGRGRPGRHIFVRPVSWTWARSPGPPLAGSPLRGPPPPGPSPSRLPSSGPLSATWRRPDPHPLGPPTEGGIRGSVPSSRPTKTWARNRSIPLPMSES